MEDNEFNATPAAIREDIRALFADYPRILTVQQAATALRIPERVIANANRRREIQAVKIGRSWHYPQAALVEWVLAKMYAPIEAADADGANLPQRRTWADARSARANARTCGR